MSTIDDQMQAAQREAFIDETARAALIGLLSSGPSAAYFNMAPKDAYKIAKAMWEEKQNVNV